jgi:serine/threonine-protein kinase
MAPEQAMAGRPVDHRADVWALGTMLYECLSGVRPVEGDTAEEVLNALFDEAITPLEVVAPAVPGQVADVVDRMLSRNVAGRPGLLEVAAVFAACTDVRSPTFGMPSSEIDVADSPGSADTDEEEEAAPMARRGG